jgi:hypothetical protein
MTKINKHVAHGFALGALWAPLLWLTTDLARRHGPHTPVIELAWWEIALIAALIALPAMTMRALKLMPAQDRGGP